MLSENEFVKAGRQGRCEDGFSTGSLCADEVGVEC